ncbi:hypothetical protein H0H92_016036, partial [Tricholoma furcatifolium]
RQYTKLQLRCNALQRKLSSWLSIHEVYIPGIASLRRLEEHTATVQKSTLKPYTLSLWLPSQIGSKISFPRHLAEVEWQLRIPQAYEAIDALRYNLQVRSHLFKFKDRFIRGQHANTRARNAISTVEAKIQAAADEYRAAYKALDSLSALLGHNEWRAHLRPLEKGDIRELSEADDERTSEGRRKISWIWMALGVIGENNDSDDLRD